MPSSQDAPPLSLPRSLVIRLMAEAQRSPDAEICGLIGHDAVANRYQVLPVPNIAADPRQRFDMDPAAQIAAMRRLREQGQSLFAIYHSHPGAVAEPSAEDLADHGYPDALQLILSLDIQGVIQLRAWNLADGRPREYRLRLIEA